MHEPLRNGESAYSLCVLFYLSYTTQMVSLAINLSHIEKLVVCFAAPVGPLDVQRELEHHCHTFGKKGDIAAWLLAQAVTLAAQKHTRRLCKKSSM